MCGRMRKGYSDTMGKSDYNRCLEGTRRIGGMDEAIRMPGIWRGSNEQKVRKDYLGTVLAEEMTVANVSSKSAHRTSTSATKETHPKAH